jgi:uncharacterized protein YbjT (DUF2867 family)
MAGDKVIAVVGATGGQGGGLARAILDDEAGPFRLRALTRKPDSEPARKLADRGAEVVRADLDDLETLKRAFDGAYGAYCVTNFWEHFSPEREKEQATHMAEAAKSAGLEHVIWSTFEDTRDWVPLDDDRMPTLQGRYKVPHFDAKAEANEAFESRDLPTTFLYTSGYWENFIYFGWNPQRGEDGVLYLTMPMGDKPLPSIAVEDIGRAAYGIFQRPDEYIGKKVGVAGEHLTGEELATAMTRALGEEVRYNDVPADVYRSFDFPGAADVGNMFQFKRDFSDVYAGRRSVEETRKLNPRLRSFDEWLSRYGDRIPFD